MDNKPKFKIFRVFHSKKAQIAVGQAIKVLTAVVLGAAMLMGLFAVLNSVVLPSTSQKVTSMFNYNVAVGGGGGSISDDIIQEGSNLSHNGFIPEGATYTTVSGEKYSDGLMPGSVSVGDTYTYGDYVYTYGGYYGFNSDSPCGWKVDINLDVTDKNQESYGEILNIIAGQDVISLNSTFSGCKNLKNIKNIPDRCTDISYAFKDCDKFTGEFFNSNKLPSRIILMNYTFENCKSLKYVPSCFTDFTEYAGSNGYSLYSAIGCFQNVSSEITIACLPNICELSYCFYGVNNLKIKDDCLFVCGTDIYDCDSWISDAVEKFYIYPNLYPDVTDFGAVWDTDGSAANLCKWANTKNSLYFCGHHYRVSSGNSCNFRTKCLNCYRFLECGQNECVCKSYEVVCPNPDCNKIYSSEEYPHCPYCSFTCNCEMGAYLGVNYKNGWYCDYCGNKQQICGCCGKTYYGGYNMCCGPYETVCKYLECHAAYCSKDYAFCPACAWTCKNCGSLVPTYSNQCSNCGTSDFRLILTNDDFRPINTAHTVEIWHESMNKVILNNDDILGMAVVFENAAYGKRYLALKIPSSVYSFLQRDADAGGALYLKLDGNRKVEVSVYTNLRYENEIKIVGDYSEVIGIFNKLA